MLRGIDGKLNHLKELGFIESALYEEVIDVNEFYNSLAGFLRQNGFDELNSFKTKEMKKVDRFIDSYFASRIEESKIWLIRAYIVGRLLAESDAVMTVFDIGLVSRLPKYVKDVAIRYGLTLSETKALENAIEFGAVAMTNTTLSTQQAVRNLMIENAKVRGGSRKLEQLLRENITGDIGEINRNWQRVAITELNNAFNNGYLSMIKEPDSYVIGLSLPDACKTCLELIDGKVYKVRQEPAPNYENISGAEYNKWAKVWDNYVWEGKNNYGRSSSKRKRLDKTAGNRKDNLVERHHHERPTPACPSHVYCRCRWMMFVPDRMYVDENNQIKLRVQNEDEWKKFNKKLHERFN